MKKIKDMLKNKKILTLLIVGLLLIITSISYAYYLFGVSQKGENQISSACFKLTIQDKNEISLQDSHPLSDEAGSKLTPYEFTIKNICGLDAKYQVNLETLNESSLDTLYLKSKLDDNSPNIVGNLDNVTTFVNDDVKESRELTTGTLLRGEEITYNLRVWTDYDSTVEQSAEKTWSGKVSIISEGTNIVKITFDANGGEVTPSELTIESGNTLILPTPTRNNYKFDGWYTKPDGGTLVDNSTKWFTSQTVYAQWRDKHTIVFDANGGNVSPKSMNVYDGETLELPIPTRYGYGFDGWYTEKDGGTLVDNSTKWYTSQTIHAHWHKEYLVAYINKLGETDTTNLLKDGTLDDNLRYVGHDANNYVRFNEETWYIIGVMNNIKTSTGETESLVKIIGGSLINEPTNYNPYGNYSWDASDDSVNSIDYGENNGYGINQWGASTLDNGTSYEGADIMRELNSDYLGNAVVGDEGYWYGSTNQKNIKMPVNTLNQTSQNMIENVEWNIGAAISSGPSDTNQVDTSIYTPMYMYTHERGTESSKQCQPTQGGAEWNYCIPPDYYAPLWTCFHYNNPYCTDQVVRTTTWTGKVALMYPSDYGFSVNGDGDVRTSCLNKTMFSNECARYSWFDRSFTSTWALTPSYKEREATEVFYYSNGKITWKTAANLERINPVVYLKSAVVKTGGDGTEENPYTIDIV